MLKRIIVTTILTLILFSSTGAFAQQSVSDVIGTTKGETVVTELDQKEALREQSFTNLLKLNLPTQTNNPSLVLTFVDPSEEKKGVQLEIDSKSIDHFPSPSMVACLLERFSPEEIISNMSELARPVP